MIDIEMKYENKVELLVGSGHRASSLSCKKNGRSRVCTATGCENQGKGRILHMVLDSRFVRISNCILDIKLVYHGNESGFETLKQKKLLDRSDYVTEHPPQNFRSVDAI